MSGGSEFSLPSGAKLLVSVAPWADIKALHDAVISELRGSGVASLDVGQVLSALDGKNPAGCNHLVDRAMAMASSKAVSAAIMKCAERAAYMSDGQIGSSRKVVAALFDDQYLGDGAKLDYYAICFRVALVNLRPFIAALSFALKAPVGSGESTPGSSASSETPSL